MNPQDIASAAGLGLIICSLLALIVPWIVLRFSSRRAAAATSGVLAVAVTILSVISSSYAGPGIPIYLVIIVPLMVVTWGMFVFLAFLAAAADPTRYRNLWLGLWTVLLAVAIFPIMGYSLAFLPAPLDTVATAIFLWPVYVAVDLFEGQAAGYAVGVLLELVYCYALVWTFARLWNKKSAT